MRVEILKGHDGQRWLRIEGSGLVTELKPVEVPKKVAGKRPETARNK